MYWYNGTCVKMYFRQFIVSYKKIQTFFSFTRLRVEDSRSWSRSKTGWLRNPAITLSMHELMAHNMYINGCSANSLISSKLSIYILFQQQST